LTRHDQAGTGFNAQPLSRPDGDLAHDEVHVWWTRLDAPDTVLASLYQSLRTDERDRASRFKVPLPGRRFVIGRAFLRLALSRYLQIKPYDLQFETSAYGKPALAGNSDLRFNLSHSEDLAVVAITSERQIGVDVERVRDDVDARELSDRFFSEQEAEWVRSNPGSELIQRFFTCWTAKEAYVKASGEGLSLPLKNFSVIPGPHYPELSLTIFDNPAESHRWTMLQLQPTADFCGALAVEGSNCRIRQGQWPEELFYDSLE
jgi:4'-phosphopantetheinyl transferase